MIRYKNLIVIPTYHQNFDFVHEVRKAFFSVSPDAIAVEFPENLSRQIMEGVNRLPKISIVVYFDDLLKEQLYVPILPSDSLIEAIRLGQEYGLPIEFIDLFVKNYTPEIPIMPDSYVPDGIPLEEFYQIVNNHLHLEETAATVQQQKAKHDQAVQQLQQENLDALESEPGSDLKSGQEALNWLKDPAEIDDLRNHFMATKLTELMNLHKTVLVVIGLVHSPHIKILLDQATGEEEFIPFVPDVKSELFNVLQEEIHFICETPNLVFQWEVFRQRQKAAVDDFADVGRSVYRLVKWDQFIAVKIIIQRSMDHYKQTYNEEVNLHKLKSLFQYLRNLPLVEDMFRPQLFDIVLAAKSIVNDDFAWIVWDECKLYPYARVDPKLDSIHINEEGIFLHGKFFKLRRHVPLHIRQIKLPLKPKPKEKNAGEWREAWNKNRWNLVSHIPEDVFEENYFQHVRLRSLNIMRDQFIRIHEFTSTLMDGIDFRETLRNWPIAQKIFVREERPIQGSVDAVVIIFDPDDASAGKDERYPHTMMWYAEHDHESDLALYTTFPGVELIGPGISRVELGGVVSFFPPRGIPDIWSSQFAKSYPYAEKKADRLLTAALIYAQKKFVTYVAKTKPSNIFYDIARRMGLQLIYLPLERFNPVSLRALRNLHMLAGKHLRKIAHHYVNKRRY